MGPEQVPGFKPGFISTFSLRELRETHRPSELMSLETEEDNESCFARHITSVQRNTGCTVGS